LLGDSLGKLVSGDSLRADCLAQGFAQAPYLREHAVGFSGKKSFIPSRCYCSPSLNKLKIKFKLFLGLGCAVLPSVRMPSLNYSYTRIAMKGEEEIYLFDYS